MKKTTKRIFVAMIVICCISGVSGTAIAKPQGTITISMPADPYSMDPILAWMTYGMYIMRHMYDTLVDFGPDGEVNPHLATSWELKDDTTWRFHLRKGVKFHNGYPFTAEDVKYSMERLLDPAKKSRYRTRYLMFKQFDVIDDYTIDIKTNYPDGLVPNRLAFFGRIVSKKWVEENGDEVLRKRAMGTGPFKFVSWKKKEEIVMEANENHFNRVPKVKRVIFRPIPETAARMASIRAGETDIVTHVPPFMVEELKKDPNVKVEITPALWSMFMVFNTLHIPELKDIRVRQAINYAIDKETICKSVLSGMATPLGLGAPPFLPGVDKSIKSYPYDPEKAKELLKEAGYEKGFLLNLYSPNGRYPMDKEMVTSLGSYLAKVGIKTKIHVFETQQYFKKVFARKMMGAHLIGYSITLWDQDGLLILVDPKVKSCYNNIPEIVELIPKCRGTLDQKERWKIGQNIQKIMHKEAVHLFLYNQISAYGVSTRVQGFEPRKNSFIEAWNLIVK